MRRLGQSVNLVGVDTTHADFVFIPMAAGTHTITLTGDAGQDWFLFNVDGVLDTNDRTTDMTS